MARSIIGNIHATGPSSSGTDSKMTALKVPDEELKMMLFMYGLQNPKQASALKTLYSLVAPPKETAADVKKKASKAEADVNLGQIDEALNILRGGKVKTGILSQIPLAFQAKTGIGADRDERRLYKLLSQFKAMEMFGVGGKALTEPERALLTPFVPGTSQTTEMNIDNLEEMKRKLQSIYGARLADEYDVNSAPITEDEYIQSGNNEDDWEDVLSF